MWAWVGNGLRLIGGWLTLGRIVLAIGGSAVVAYSVSFFVADYVSKASVGGLSKAIDGLQASIDDLRVSLREINNEIRVDVRILRDEREQFALRVAKEVAALQVQDAGQAANLEAVRAGVERIELRLDRDYRK